MSSCYIPEGDHGGEVEWRDSCAYAERGAHGGEVHVLGDAGQRLAQEEVGQRAALLHHLQPAHHVALRVRQRLALLQRDQSRNLFLNERKEGAPQQSAA